MMLRKKELISMETQIESMINTKKNKHHQVLSAVNMFINYNM